MTGRGILIMALIALAVMAGAYAASRTQALEATMNTSGNTSGDIANQFASGQLERATFALG